MAWDTNFKFGSKDTRNQDSSSRRAHVRKGTRRCPSCFKQFKCLTDQPRDRVCSKCFNTQALRQSTTPSQTDTNFILKQVAERKGK